MGCGGGFHNLFRILDDCGSPRRGCGSNRNSYYEYNTPNDINEKLMLLKHMYADGLINDREYEKYSEYIYTRRISFDELVNIKINKSKSSSKHKSKAAYSEYEETSSRNKSYNNKYYIKIKKLKESKEKIINLTSKIVNSIKELEKEKAKMESMAEVMLKSNEETAERYIIKKLDLEENIQNINRRKKELQNQLEEIERSIKELEAKDLELEAQNLQEEMSNFKL